MNASIIVFAGIIVAGIFGLPLALRGIHRIFKDVFKWQDRKDEKQQAQKIESIKDDLKQAIESGSLADLIDASKKLGDSKRK